MSYLSIDASPQLGAPFMLFEFVRGGEVWRYCDQVQTMSAMSATWEPAPIAPSEISQSGELAKDKVSFRFPTTNPFAATFLGHAPGRITTVTVYRGHHSSDEVWVVWKGRVSGSDASADAISVECEAIFTSMQRPGLRARYQRTCRHALYQRGCNLDRAAFAVAATVTAAAGRTVTIAADGLQPGYCSGGMIELASGEICYIIEQSDRTLTLIRPFPVLAAELQSAPESGVSVTLYPGCDRSLETCSTKFDNILNYGGFPWIPTKNPFGGTSLT